MVVEAREAGEIPQEEPRREVDQELDREESQLLQCFLKGKTPFAESQNVMM